MIHVASNGDMPFVSNARKTRSVRAKLQNQSPVRTTKLPLKSRALEKLNAQEMKRYTIGRRASTLADGSVDVKHQSGHLRSALLRIRQTIMHPKSEKLHIHHNHASPSARPATTNQIQIKSAKVARTVGLPPRVYTICEECSRRCAFLDVIMEEDFDESGLSEEVENKIQLTPSSCSLASSRLPAQSPYSKILSV
ncbi:hypothetical protein Aperf_G00000100676 [Anoplocephala perfoliata]